MGEVCHSNRAYVLFHYTLLGLFWLNIFADVLMENQQVKTLDVVGRTALNLREQQTVFQV